MKMTIMLIFLVLVQAMVCVNGLETSCKARTAHMNESTNVVCDLQIDILKEGFVVLYSKTDSSFLDSKTVVDCFIYNGTLQRKVSDGYVFDTAVPGPLQTLIIRQLTEDSAGHYLCQLHNGKGRTFTPCTLEIKEENKPQPQTVESDQENLNINSTEMSTEATAKTDDVTRTVIIATPLTVGILATGLASTILILCRRKWFGGQPNDLSTDCAGKKASLSEQNENTLSVKSDNSHRSDGSDESDDSGGSTTPLVKPNHTSSTTVVHFV